MYPMKVYRNQIRSDKQAYQPDIILDTTKSTAQLQQEISQRFTNGQYLKLNKIDGKQADENK